MEFERWDQVPEHEIDSAMSAYGPQHGMDDELYMQGLQDQIQLQRDIEYGQMMGYGSFADTAYGDPISEQAAYPQATPQGDLWSQERLERDFIVHQKREERRAQQAEEAAKAKQAEADKRKELEVVAREKMIKYEKVRTEALRTGHRFPPPSPRSAPTGRAIRTAQRREAARSAQPRPPLDILAELTETAPASSGVGPTIVLISKWVLCALAVLMIAAIFSNLV
ncbi:hypothetical protein FGF04_33180 [Streptomyces apricus]|uniref:Uncharacterized protein n=1 Tax=Streptomyces apricus TaxID=1828112 RepID=A0A5B0A580_9ACTN|nr:hypothetical protein FGF04_33180 [Streptomyces apricus]